jgi:ribonuclease/clavin/mitogillin
MGEPTIEALYEQMRAAAPVTHDDTAPTLLQVAPQIRRLALRTPTLPPAAHTNAYLVGPDRGPQYVVDPGSPYADQQAALDAVLAQEADAGRPLAGVLLTHHHGDHVGGAAATAARWGVPVLGHARTAARVPVQRELAGGDDLGGIVAIHTPGHADGHLCFAIGDAIIAGDMVAGIGTILIDPSEGDMAVYLDSLRALLARPAAMLLPAHGPVIPDGHAKLREYITHRTMREDRVLAALGKRAASTLGELVADAYSDTPRILWPLAERSLRAHLVKLEREGRAREEISGTWART